jgi:hypothetical protein
MPPSTASQPLTRVQLRLGWDCVLKLRYAREGLAQRQGSEDAEPGYQSELIEELYWSCAGEHVDARALSVRRAVPTVAGAVATARATGMPVRIRGLMLRMDGFEVRVGVLVIRPGRWEVGEIFPRLMEEDPAEFLVTKRGAIFHEWRDRVVDVAISQEMVRRWVVASGSSLGVDPGLDIAATMIGLRRHDATPNASGADVDGASLRSLREFGHSFGTGNDAVIRTRGGSAQEAKGTFVHVPMDQVLDRMDVVALGRGSGESSGNRFADVGSGMDALRSFANSQRWPVPRQCIGKRCRDCEFRVRGDPESGFSRCWGAEVDHQRDHILELERLSEAQFDEAVERDGFRASVAAIAAGGVRESQEQSVRALDEGVIHVSDDLKAWSRDRAGSGIGDAPGPHAVIGGPSHFLEISTASVPVAAWPGARPYELVPFRFSVHRLPSDASPLDQRISLPGFVRCDIADPRRDFIRALREQLGEFGPVYHWDHLERGAVRSLRDGLAASVRQPGDDELIAFLSGLVGTDGSPGRLVDLQVLARGFRPPEGSWSRSLRHFVRYAWKFQRISAAFRQGNGATGDPASYEDPIDPMRSLPTIPALAPRDSNVSAGLISASDPLAPQRLWLECRLADGRDPGPVHDVLRAWGNLQSASVLMAYYFLVHVAPVLAQQSADRTVRVFVSSTFRDFRAERDLLKRQVQPTLNRRSLDRAVEATIVDLRWGITDEQAGQGMTLPVCLREVERCRPYFIGLLGHRYGWIPAVSAYPADLLERQPWLKEYVGGASITELEIRHGILDDARGDARFYFRAHAFAAGKGDDFESKDPEDRRRLAALKQAIRERGFRVTEDYPNPPAFARGVTEDIWNRIDETFPADLLGEAALPDWAAHRAHAVRLARTFVEDTDELKAIRGLLADAKVRRVAIVGPTGCGKSALFSVALRPYAESAHCTLIHHFVGIGSTQAKAADVARRIVVTAAARVGLGLGDPRLVDPRSEEALRAVLDEALARETRLMIAIDGIDRIADVHSIAWLHARPLPGLKLVLTALSSRGIPHADLPRAGGRAVRVRELSPSRARAMVEEVLRWNGRELKPDQLDAIAGHRCATSPGFLRVVIDELMACSSHEDLPKRIGDCLAVRSVAELHALVLQRLESEIGEQAVRQILGTLLAAPAGMLESEVVDAVGGKHAELSALRLQLAGSLVDAGGRLSIPPGALADAMRRRVSGKR